MSLKLTDKVATLVEGSGGKHDYFPVSEFNTLISSEEAGRLTALELIAQTAIDGEPVMIPVASEGSLEIAEGISLDFTAKTKGDLIPGLIVNLIDPEALNETIDVVVNGTEIDVTLASTAVPAITSTAANVKAAIEATPAAHALVSVAITGTTSTLAIAGTADLIDGVDGTPGVAGQLRYGDDALYLSKGISTTAVSNWEKISYDAE